jgi:PAN domain
MKPLPAALAAIALSSTLAVTPPAAQPARRGQAVAPAPRGPAVLVTPASPLQPSAPAPRPPSLLVKRDDANRRRVMRADLATGTSSELYRSRTGTVDDLQVAPDDVYVAVIETAEGRQENGEYVVPPVNRLVILRADGTRVRTVDADVRQYTFSPDGSRLAYITGSYYEGGTGFKPTGAFILDIASGQSQRIAGADLSIELNWIATPEENALYLKTLDTNGTGIQRFDIARNTVDRPASPAFRISPDGRYYLVPPYETIEAGSCEPAAGDDSCLRVYERKSNSSIPFFQSRAIGTHVGWAYGQGHALLFTKREAVKVDRQMQRGGRIVRGRLAPQIRDADNTIYDVESRKPIERFRGVVGGIGDSEWIGSTRTLVVRDATRAQPAAPTALEGLTLRRVAAPVRLPPNVIAATRPVLPDTMTTLPGVNLPGGDYRTVDAAASAEACEAECAGDNRCRAFTFVRPATRGRSGRCLLKSSVPAAQRDRRYVSGTKVQRGQ